MKKNMALSFYDYPESKEKIDKLETEIIKQLKPILNIDHKNPENPYLNQIKQLRKKCASIAIKNSDFKNLNLEKKTKKTKKALGTTTSKMIYIDNISKSDIKSRNIRIKVENKHLFPAEKLGQPIYYDLEFKAGDKDFIAKYTIGSKDGKSRSGVLKFEHSIYQDTLKIKIGTNLKICKSMDNKYMIERL